MRSLLHHLTFQEVVDNCSVGETAELGRTFPSFYLMEFPDLGSSCSKCKELDFLPFVCVFCGTVLCKEHLLPSNHACPDYVDNVVDVTAAKQSKVRCKFCKEPIIQSLEQVCCSKCNLIHCLKHRIPESHECPKLKEEYLQRIRSQRQESHPVKKVVEAPKVKGSKNEDLARKVALMKLKQKAKGPAIPIEERLYLFVENDEDKDRHPFYFSKTWTLGKCLDFTLESIGVRNCNRNGVKNALSLSGGDILPFDVTVQQVVDEGKLLPGDCLVLKSVE